MVNANAEVYYESSTNYYTYKGSLSSGGSMDVSVSYYSPVWVLVIPSSSSAFVNVTATTNYSYSSYSSDDSYLVAIIVPTVVGGTILIVIVVLIIVWSAIRRQRMLQYQSNMAAAVAYHANQAPQLYYPPQQNYSVGYTNQGAVVMGTQHSTYPFPQTPRQNVYIIEPTPRTSEPIAYGPADPVPENSVYVAQGVPVNQ